jgi:hypothetical protein
MVLETSERRERTQICAGCRKEINHRRADSRFCSSACRQAAYRERLAVKAAAAERAAEAARKASDEARRRYDRIAALIG